MFSAQGLSGTKGTSEKQKNKKQREVEVADDCCATTNNFDIIQKKRSERERLMSHFLPFLVFFSFPVRSGRYRGKTPTTDTVDAVAQNEPSTCAFLFFFSFPLVTIPSWHVPVFVSRFHRILFFFSFSPSRPR